MRASIVDLRYNTAKILRALEHGEAVTLTYHDKPKGIIAPIVHAAGSVASSRRKVGEHPFCGMYAGDTRSVEDVMRELRAPRAP